jgi:hypothetical protein
MQQKPRRAFLENFDREPEIQFVELIAAKLKHLHKTLQLHSRLLQQQEDQHHCISRKVAPESQLEYSEASEAIIDG